VRPALASLGGIWAAALLLSAACLGAHDARAQPAPAVVERGAAWQSLTPAQRGALGPLQAEWPALDGGSKQKWMELASRFPAMSPDERSRVQVRMADWARMTPAERGRARLQFQETRQLSPQDRQTRWEAYKALPSTDRNALAAKAAPALDQQAPALRAAARAAASGEKSNVVSSTSLPVPTKPVAPTVMQAKPGATTTLMSSAASPPAHHQPGLPKIAATQGFVDPATLLPKRGPQGAAIATAPAASAPGPRQR
jgi:hypothetical protein